MISTLRGLAACALTAATVIATPGFAETLSGQEAVNYLVGQKRTFAAGSVSQFNSDGTYAFAHANGTDTGTFSVTSNGKITLKHSAGPGKGKTDVFVIDASNGTYAAQYVSGRLKGKSFAFK